MGCGGMEGGFMNCCGLGHPSVEGSRGGYGSDSAKSFGYEVNNIGHGLQWRREAAQTTVEFDAALQRRRRSRESGGLLD